MILCGVISILLTSLACTAANNIKLPIVKRHKSPIHHGHLDKRVVHYAQLFNDDGSEYLIHIGIGTPIQNFTLSLDTGR